MLISQWKKSVNDNVFGFLDSKQTGFSPGKKKKKYMRGLLDELNTVL